MELYLSRILLNTSSKAVMNDLGNPRELHKTLSRCFPAIEGQDDRPQPERDTPRNVYGLLHRLDRVGESFVLYVQSNIRPAWERLPSDYGNADFKAIHDLYSHIRDGDRLQFQLTANPTKRAGKSDLGHVKFRDENKRRRIDIRSEEGRVDWLARKGTTCGFSLCEATLGEGVAAVETSAGHSSNFKHDKGRVTLGHAVFKGVLEVTDANQFRQALAEGIGTGKAYGFGLMSVART